MPEPKKPTPAQLAAQVSHLQTKLAEMTEDRDKYSQWWREERERGKARDGDISKLVNTNESLQARASEADRLRGMIDGFERAGVLPDRTPHADHITRSPNGLPR